MANQEIIAKITIDSNDGVRLGLVQGWPRVVVKIGKHGIEIWDDRKASREALEEVYKTYQELVDVKRHRKLGAEPKEVRQKRAEARRRFWEVFQDPAEVIVGEKPIRGGEGTISFLTLYDTEETPELILQVFRTSGRWARDSSFFPIRAVPDEKGERWLHLIISSSDSSVDLIEKNEEGVVTRSTRFIGEELIIRKYTEGEIIEEKAEEEEEELEIKEIPPVITTEEAAIDPEAITKAQAALQAAKEAKERRENKNKRKKDKK